MLLQTLTLLSLLSTFSDNIGPETPNLAPLQELIEKRAFTLQTKLEPLDSYNIAISAINVGIETRIDPLLFLALIEIESRYDKKAKSKKGCKGLTQVSSKIGDVISNKLNLKNYNLYNIYDSIKIGGTFLSDLLKQFPNILIGLTIYNKGYGNWIKNPEISNYAYAIKKRYNYLKKLYNKEKFYVNKS